VQPVTAVLIQGLVFLPLRADGCNAEVKKVNQGNLRDDRLRQDVEASYMDVFTRVDE
jgi:hypothetical protein